MEDLKTDKKVGKIIMGGPMMGIAQYTTNIPTNKGYIRNIMSR
ncbi:hypothetical protein Q5M85_08720 [Paraclostridium bifermentans]|nr:hypothetical protein [Paraclostridium bifermentans]